MSYDTILQGNIITPSACLEHGWIASRAGLIAAIGEGEPPPSRQYMDYGKAWIIPGGIDAQVHAGSYWGLPGIRPTTRSATAGGITTIVDMPFDTPAILSTMALLEAKLNVIETDAYCDVALYGTVAPGQNTAQMGPLAAAGICAFKISVCESHPLRFPRIAADQQLAILREAAALGLPVGVHNEDQEIVRASTARIRAGEPGSNLLQAHDACRPEAAELAATATFVELAALAGAHAHIVHVSTPRGFDLLQRYSRDGYQATGEICIHYLVFDPTVHGEEFGAKLKVNPPLRSGVREELWKRVARGEVTCISSDHSTMSLANKLEASFFEAGPGMPGLASMIPAFFTGLRDRGLDAPRLVAEHLSEKPAKLFGLWPRKGAIRVGSDADFTVIDEGSFIYDSSQAQDEVHWSPYDGMTFAARIAATFVRGQQVWNGSEVVGRQGGGYFIPRLRQ